jgi:alpha-D-ribose 1-methylphosphonate 5-triphosphate synthase subunit PhnI
VEAAGFVEHLKLPHYVDFQAELGLIRSLRREFQARHGTGASASAKIDTATETDTDTDTDTRIEENA